MNRLMLLAGVLLPFSIWAQTPDFQAADRFDAPNLQKQIGTQQIIPFYLKKSNAFWFRVDRPEAGPEYYLVEPFKKKKTQLFDKKAIAGQLEKIIQKAPEQSAIVYKPEFSEDEQSVEVAYKGKIYGYAYLDKKLFVQPKKQVQKRRVYHTGNMSRDKKWLLYARHHNLYLKSMTDSSERALSSDGAAYHSFSINEEDEFSKVNSATDAVWTPDSKAFYILRKDTRKVQTMTVISSVSSTIRPYVNNYKYELPGDEYVTQYELFLGSPEASGLTKVNIQRWPDQEVEILPNQTSNKEIFLLRKKRSRDEMELCAVNISTGLLRVVIHELSKPMINRDLFQVYLVNAGKDILWWSDRTGWGQYYHYDQTGRLLNAITKGNWTAGKVMAIDTARRTMFFYGYGKEKERNPNYAFLYKAGFDGGNPELLTPDNANHNVSFSPFKDYFLDQYSRIDLEPVSVLRSRNGKLLQEIYRPEFGRLYAYGWKRPEMFTVKAKDGVTDLYGLMWKPFNFDPAKKYPIISQVYPGPFTETVWNDFTVTDRYNNTSLAQVGFIVVVMGHRGSSPYRNAEYYKFGHGNLRDYALEDDKYGLEQLGARYHFIDLNRVGIFGHSGGGMMSAAAICTYPDFYKVAVSSSGNHDNRIYNRTWAETYQGFDGPVAINQSLAKNLKGHLLLVTGESDPNVNPAGTYRMADALIKANKYFDLLVLPGQSHTYEEPYKTYFQRRLRRYFSTYLLSL
ncbi:S9 family peptidase [Pedobacter africanus]|uniref:Dipeptidyl aminopeptidase/acylaminoacyl peptidase n=1 Tax=Pedobacter africanus TaxID=151894 RepID=A0ACC6KZ42_9SPHI|nr:DPP IV N-terminal domain-containing protein [Pedobacter africanus]MDR6784519.1 dipeptidyl aminopeptidase/acylaminoacyl peptidase [Pedobacter africanus]